MQKQLKNFCIALEIFRPETACFPYIQQHDMDYVVECTDGRKSG